MAAEYNGIETFEITGRGLVAVIKDRTSRKVAFPHRVEVILKDGTRREAVAYKELLLRRQPVVRELEAYVLEGFRRSDVPVGSVLRFVESSVYP